MLKMTSSCVGPCRMSSSGDSSPSNSANNLLPALRVSEAHPATTLDQKIGFRASNCHVEERKSPTEAAIPWLSLQLSLATLKGMREARTEHATVDARFRHGQVAFQSRRNCELVIGQIGPCIATGATYTPACSQYPISPKVVSRRK